MLLMFNSVHFKIKDKKSSETFHLRVCMRLRLRLTLKKLALLLSKFTMSLLRAAQ